MTPLPTTRLMLRKPNLGSKCVQLRFNTSQAQKPVSPHIGFYKTFTRPVAKVLLMATFTYQLAYWGWVKLEKDEIKRHKAEIEHLETQLGNLTKEKRQKT